MYVFFLLNSLVLSENVLCSSNDIDLFIFLNIIIINIPMENSKAAKPIMNKLVDNKVKSSFIEPMSIV